MDLTKTQKHLINICKMLQMTEEETIVVILAVQQPEKAEKLLDYIIEQHEKNQLDSQEVILKAMEISQE